MLNPRFPVRTTILGDAASVTEVEKVRFADEWAKRSLEVLLAYADYHSSFAKHLCEKVADKYGPNDDLSAVLLHRLRIDRKGKPKARRKTWTRARYFVLLVHYQALMEFRKNREEVEFGKNREEVLTMLAKQEDIRNVDLKKIEEKITEARKQISQDELPEFCRHPPALRKKGG